MELYERVDASRFVNILPFPLELVFEIVDYTYAKCVDCNHYVFVEYTCRCERVRCLLHQYLNMGIHECKLCEEDPRFEYGKIYLKCIIPDCREPAKYGYKDSILYCSKHSMNKKNIRLYCWCNSKFCFFITCLIDNNGYVKCEKHGGNLVNIKIDKYNM